MTFKDGDKVMLVGTHVYNGRVYTHEANSGDVGAILNSDSKSSLVTWDHNGARSNVDNACLRLVGNAPTEGPTPEELRAVFQSLGVEPPPNEEATAVAAFLQGMLAAECMKMARAVEPVGLKVRAVEQGADELGNYQKHFTVITESGIRLRVQITPEEGA